MKMDETVFDTFGYPIITGAKVIYNLSGNLAYGEIIKTQKAAYTTRYAPGIRYTYRIEIRLIRESDTVYTRPDHISIVRNPNCIVVIRDNYME